MNNVFLFYQNHLCICHSQVLTIYRVPSLSMTINMINSASCKYVHYIMHPKPYRYPCWFLYMYVFIRKVPILSSMFAVLTLHYSGDCEVAEIMQVPHKYIYVIKPPIAATTAASCADTCVQHSLSVHAILILM